MEDLEKQVASFKAEADAILYKYGLLKIMEKYGTPFITGSYVLGTMTRRDLDINLETDSITIDRFFQMGSEIAVALQAGRILYLNEFVDRHPRLPLGLYIGVYTRIIGENQEWNIDIWAMDIEQSLRNKKVINDFRLAMDTDKKKKELILKIKSKSLEHQWYQRSFFSTDIYNAVINEDVKNTEQFFERIKTNKNIDISI
jgi:hypothetical protein